MDASLIFPHGELATVQSLRWDVVQGFLFTLWLSEPCLSHLEFTAPNSYENEWTERRQTWASVL